MNKMNLRAGQIIGEGARAIVIDKVSSELLYVRVSQNDNALRYIPTKVISDLVNAIKKNTITIDDISRKFRSEKNLPHLFDELGWNTDKYILGYDSTIQKICEHILKSHSTDVEKFAPDENKLSKPFLLLAGISGTGKTRFVREQAQFSGQFDETYCLTSVRPDWHEPSDLLGYISRLNGSAEYITTDVLQFIAKAWGGIANSVISVDVQDLKGQGKRLVVTGNSATLDQVLPYWLCLDEMNLAPVEQYFADYLSVLETRQWRWEDDSFTYTSDALLKPATINEVALKDQLRKDLGFESSTYDELWGFFCKYGLPIPFNLLVAGTVNMDETTHGFSRKVIDRALSFDFGAFFPNDYNKFFSPTICNKRLSYPIWSHAVESDLAITFDTDGQKSSGFLTAINEVLKDTPFELAYRALNELLISVISNNPQDELTLKAVWDDFMMMKVLPRIEGDTDKLTKADGKRILAELGNVLDTHLATDRPDLYRENTEGTTEIDKIIPIPCRSRSKLKWMSERLANATFTSFWP